MEREQLFVLNKDELSPMLKEAFGEIVQSESFKETVTQAMVEEPEVVRQEAASSAIAKLGEVKILGIPIGEALLGGTTAVVANEIIDLVAEKIGLRDKIGGDYSVAVVEAISAFCCHKWLGKLVGQKGADLAATMLVWDAINEVVHLKDMIRDLIPGHNPREFGAEPLVSSPMEASPFPANSVVQTAERVASDYYGRAFGG